jgi:hypothetical protein
MARHWPNQPDRDPFARSLNGLPKYVASRTLREPLGWRDSSLLGADVRDHLHLSRDVAAALIRRLRR